MAHLMRFGEAEIPIEVDGKLQFVNSETAALMRGNIYLTGVITEEYALNVVHQLNFLNKSRSIKEIVMWIDNHGGYVHSAFTILNTIELLSKPVVTINMGIAYSAAAVILAHGKKGERFVYANSKTLIHVSWTDGLGGKEHEIEELLRDMKLDNQLLYERLSKETGKPVELLKAIMRENRYLSAKEAIKLGLADKIMTKRDYKRFQP